MGEGGGAMLLGWGPFFALSIHYLLVCYTHVFSCTVKHTSLSLVNYFRLHLERGESLHKLLLVPLNSCLPFPSGCLCSRPQCRLYLVVVDVPCSMSVYAPKHFLVWFGEWACYVMAPCLEFFG